MKSMWRMYSRDHRFVVFQPIGIEGLEAMKRLRRDDDRFRGQHIVNVLQAYPSKYQAGVIYPV